MRASTYIVAATPRSGSTLLCTGLTATGIAGRPTETFAPHLRQWWLEQWSMPLDTAFGDFFSTALAYGTTANGVYGLKIHWEHVPLLARDLTVVARPDRVLHAAFPHAAYVSIVRRDLRAQALSLYRALATNEWCRIAGSDPVPAGSLPLDQAAVRGLETAILAQREGWDRYFAANRLAPLTVEYEALDADYRGQVARVLEFLELDETAAGTIPPPPLLRQSDEVSAAWRTAMDDNDTRQGG